MQIAVRQDGQANKERAQSVASAYKMAVARQVAKREKHTGGISSGNDGAIAPRIKATGGTKVPDSMFSGAQEYEKVAAQQHMAYEAQHTQHQYIPAWNAERMAGVSEARAMGVPMHRMGY